MSFLRVTSHVAYWGTLLYARLRDVEIVASE